MAWHTTPLSLLNTYRVSHNLSTPAAFTSPLNQALLVNPGIGRQSPTMARRKDKRRVSKEQLATNVRKHFNGAAVNEIDVVVELVYKSRNKGMYPKSCYQHLGEMLLTLCRQSIPHALSAWNYQEVMTEHYTTFPTSTNNNDNTYDTLHYSCYNISAHLIRTRHRRLLFTLLAYHRV